MENITSPSKCSRAQMRKWVGRVKCLINKKLPQKRKPKECILLDQDPRKKGVKIIPWCQEGLKSLL